MPFNLAPQVAIFAGSIDPVLFQTVAELNVPYVPMHMKGTPHMQDNPTYSNVIEEVYSFFETKLEELKKLGVDDVVLDPGFGFGKTLQDNYTLLNNLNIFSDLGSIILSGISRKSEGFIKLLITVKLLTEKEILI